MRAWVAKNVNPQVADTLRILYGGSGAPLLLLIGRAVAGSSTTPSNQKACGGGRVCVQLHCQRGACSQVPPASLTSHGALHAPRLPKMCSSNRLLAPWPESIFTSGHACSERPELRDAGQPGGRGRIPGEPTTPLLFILLVGFHNASDLLERPSMPTWRTWVDSW